MSHGVTDITVFPLKDLIRGPEVHGYIGMLPWRWRMSEMNSAVEVSQAESEIKAEEGTVGVL